MTWKEFTQLDWRFSVHLAMADEHCLTYTAEANGHTFGMCRHTPTEEYKQVHPHAREYIHWRIDGMIFKNKTKFVKELETIDSKVNQ